MINLYEAEAPKAVANFKALCTGETLSGFDIICTLNSFGDGNLNSNWPDRAGEKGISKESKKPLHYKVLRPCRPCALCFQC